MNVNNTVTMVVGLVVGVLLIAGVVTPVIANVSSDEGGGGGSATTTLRNDSGETNYYFKPVTQDTQIQFVSGSSPNTIYAYVGGSATQEWSSHLVLAGDTWTVMTTSNGHFMMSNTNGGGYTVYSIVVNGSEVTLNDGDGWVYPENVRYYSWYEGDYVVSASSSTGRQVVPYLASDSQSYISMGLDDGSRVTVVGSKDSNTAHYVYVENYNPVFEDLGTADVSIENNKLKSVTCTYNSVAMTFDWNTPESYIEYAIVPVEVTVSGSSGPVTYTNSGDVHYSIADGSSSITYYAETSDKWSLEPPSVPDREIYEGTIFFTVDGVLWQARAMAFIEQDPAFILTNKDGGYTATSMTISGTTLSFLDKDSNTRVTLQNVGFYADPNGDYVDTSDIEEQKPASLYATSKSPILYYAWLEDYNDYSITIMGTVESNTVSVHKDYDEGSPAIETIGGPAIFTIEDGQLSTVTVKINGSDYTFDANISENDGGVMACILPVTVSEGGSGGSGLSPTLKTMLSVIPLILTVGLVIGAIGYLRFKE